MLTFSAYSLKDLATFWILLVMISSNAKNGFKKTSVGLSFAMLLMPDPSR